jgi:hypothetical protein
MHRGAEVFTSTHQANPKKLSKLIKNSFICFSNVFDGVFMVLRTRLGFCYLHVADCYQEPIHTYLKLISK